MRGATPADPVGLLPGIGPTTQTWLEAAGIATVGDLRMLGSVEAYRHLKFLQPRSATVNALHALEAALRGCHWLHLPPEVKTTLQHQAKATDLALRKAAAGSCSID